MDSIFNDDLVMNFVMMLKLTVSNNRLLKMGFKQKKKFK